MLPIGTSSRCPIFDVGEPTCRVRPPDVWKSHAPSPKMFSSQLKDDVARDSRDIDLGMAASNPLRLGLGALPRYPVEFPVPWCSPRPSLQALPCHGSRLETRSRHAWSLGSGPPICSRNSIVYIVLPRSNHSPPSAIHSLTDARGPRVSGSSNSFDGMLEYRTFKWTHRRQLRDSSMIAEMPNSPGQTSRPTL